MDRLESIQKAELPDLLDFLRQFWRQHASWSSTGRVVPLEANLALDDVMTEPFPEFPGELGELLTRVGELLQSGTVKTGHPLFLGYVTPPSLDIAALGDALASIVNQNVAFAALSPLGAALERTVIGWLGQIVGYPAGCGGILTSGGSNANLYGLAVARRRLLGLSAASDGNYAEILRLRVYCSDQTHHSVEKAAMLLGLGADSVKRIATDAHHRIRLNNLRAVLKRDLHEGRVRPMAIVGNAGTRLCCAYDNLRALRELADEHGLWFHVDAAYGGFLALARRPPAGATDVGLGDSVVLDPHKLLFVPFDCGSLLVRDPLDLTRCFGAEGEYREMRLPGGLDDYANHGMQLGRSMKALKVWMVLKRFGRAGYAAEYTRLLEVARHLVRRIDADSQFERLGPAGGTAICFRWKGGSGRRYEELDAINSAVRQTIIREGRAFIDEVVVDGKRGLRLCITNFRVNAQDIDGLLEAIGRLASSIRC